MHRVASLTARGRRRPNNEDAVLTTALPEGALLLAVADGVGGERAGEIASRSAVRLLEQQVAARARNAPADRLRPALRHVNSMLWQRAQGEPHLHGMATTVVAAIVDRGQAWLANVGDSRVYIVHEGGARQLTRDHSLVAERVREGNLTEEEARQSQSRHVITRSVGSGEDLDVDTFGPIALPPGCRLVLCSDGLYGAVDDHELAAAASQAAPADAVRILVDLANERGGPDNISVIIYAEPGEGGAGTERRSSVALEPPGRYTIAGITAARRPQPPRPAGTRSDYVVARGQEYGLGSVLGPQLRQDRAQVVLDGVRTQVQRRRDALVRESPPNQLQDLALLRRKAAATRRVPLEPVDEGSGYPRVQDESPQPHCADRLRQVRRLGILEQVAARSRFDGVRQRHPVPVGAENEHAGIGCDSAQTPAQIDAAPVSHSYVDRHHVRCQRFRLADRFVNVPSFRHNPHIIVVFDECGDAISHDRMVVHHHDIDGSGLHVASPFLRLRRKPAVLVSGSQAARAIWPQRRRPHMPPTIVQGDVPGSMGLSVRCSHRRMSYESGREIDL